MVRKIVIPGELLTAEKKRLGGHVFIKEGKIHSDCVGLLNEGPDSIGVIPLEGPYLPQANDIIIGFVLEEKFAGYTLDINSFYSSFLPKRELDFFAKSGDIVSVKIASVNEVNEVELTGARLLAGGELTDISPVKIPRLIGKEGSMLNVIKRGTSAVVVAGRNGRIWLKGGNIKLALETIRLIESEAHKEHLTDRVTKFLEEKTNTKLGAEPARENHSRENNSRESAFREEDNSADIMVENKAECEDI